MELCKSYFRWQYVQMCGLQTTIGWIHSQNSQVSLQGPICSLTVTKSKPISGYWMCAVDQEEAPLPKVKLNTACSLTENAFDSFYEYMYRK